MDHKRIVFTGMGIVSPYGFGKKVFWDNLTEGRSGISTIELFSTTKYDSYLGGVYSTFDPRELLDKKGLRLLDRTTTLTLCAAKLALEDANINQTKNSEQKRMGFVLSSTCGSPKSRSDFYYTAISKGFTSINPALFPNTVVNSPASQVSIRFGINGLNSTISTGFNGTLQAIKYAVQLIRSNKVEMVMVGGTEEMCEMLFSCFSQTGFLSQSNNDNCEISSPFDKNRNGAVLGEGSTIFILESLEHAKKRKTHVYGEYIGGITTFDPVAFRKYNSKGTGAKKAVKSIMKIYDTQPGEINLIVSGANSSFIGDLAESKAIKFLTKNNNAPIITAPKSMLGESFSAGGGFQIATALLSMESGLVPPIINSIDPDPNCINNFPISCLKNKQISLALITSFSPICQQSVCFIQKLKN